MLWVCNWCFWFSGLDFGFVCLLIFVLFDWFDYLLIVNLEFGGFVDFVVLYLCFLI